MEIITSPGGVDAGLHPKITVVAPVYNEESVVDELLRRISEVLDNLPGGPHEIVLVDDGSTDRTLAILEDAARQDRRLVVVSLSRNFGHQAALSAALDYASGAVVVIIDGDLQDPPEAIPLFLEEFHKGFDVVYAVRVNRKEGLLLRICYGLFYRVVAGLAEVRLPLDAGDFALMSRRVVDLIRQSPERQRYLRGLRCWYGFQQKGIAIERHVRHSGRPKYNARKLIRLASDGIFAFSVLPLRLATFLGLSAVTCSVVYAIYSLATLLFREFPPNQSSRSFMALIFVVTFLSGVQLLFLGVIGEYIGRIYEEVKQRPHYVVKKVVGRGER